MSTKMSFTLNSTLKVDMDLLPYHIRSQPPGHRHRHRHGDRFYFCREQGQGQGVRFEMTEGKPDPGLDST
ncbi:hypothetical protein F0562_013760 [Nyssa sinensis]|uniref:Uncharacterized protein n=1 Tax=Nyssa sinensis TaxID=561372 RepID=A0A5J4ZNU2_9ASTE|nr:hypothetical protein F0562_013760 [Nyssa sinensis]